MVAGKKKPEDPGGSRLLRDNAEEQLVRSPKCCPGAEGQTTPQQLIHELEVHQIELETQAEELRRAYIAFEGSRDKYLDLYDFSPTGYFTLTDKVLIAGVNLTGAMLLGVERSDLVNAPFSKFVAVQDSDRLYLYFKQMLQNVEKQTYALMLTPGTALSGLPAWIASDLTTYLMK